MSRVFRQDYDYLNRLYRQTFPTGSDITTIETAYDPNNNVEQVTENKPGGTDVTTYTYDMFDRMKSSTQRGHLITYDYDDNGNRTLVASAQGTTTYTFDSRNRLEKAISGGEETTYAYFQTGEVKRVTYPNGTQTNNTIDDVGRVKSITNSKIADGSLISSFAYDYDRNGNRDSQVEIQNGFANGQQEVITYECSGQLKPDTFFREFS